MNTLAEASTSQNQSGRLSGRGDAEAGLRRLRLASREAISASLLHELAALDPPALTWLGPSSQLPIFSVLSTVAQPAKRSAKAIAKSFIQPSSFYHKRHAEKNPGIHVPKTRAAKKIRAFCLEQPPLFFR